MAIYNHGRMVKMKNQNEIEDFKEELKRKLEGK